jgi:hypothetical protein
MLRGFAVVGGCRRVRAPANAHAVQLFIRSFFGVYYHALADLEIVQRRALVIEVVSGRFVQQHDDFRVLQGFDGDRRIALRAEGPHHVLDAVVSEGESGGCGERECKGECLHECSLLLQSVDQGGDDFKQITDYTVIRHFEDRRLRVFVDRDDRLRALHADQVLDGA